VLHRRQYLSGIEDILRIERLLDRAHGVDGLTAEFGLEVFLLALPDAVLAGAGAAHRLRAFDQPMHEVLAARHLVGSSTSHNSEQWKLPSPTWPTIGDCS
jgi:hypothetical protein